MELLQRAGAELREGKTAQALKLLEEVKRRPALSPAAAFQMGWLYGQARQYRTAMRIFESLPESAPDVTTHQYAVALCHFNLGEYRKAAEILDELKARGLADTKVLNLLGVAYAKSGEAEKAYNSLRDGLLENPGDLQGYLNLVTLCVDYQNLALAQKIALRGMAQFPNSSELQMNLGAVRMLSGKPEEARENFRKAKALAPDNPETSFFLGLAAYQTGSYTEAVATLEQSVREGHADADVHYLLAESVLRANPDHADKALYELDRAIQLDPQLAPALAARARLYLNQSKPANAVSDLERARTIDPEGRSILYNLARAYRMLGRESEARTLFAKVQRDTRNTVDAFARKRIGKILVERTGSE